MTLATIFATGAVPLSPPTIALTQASADARAVLDTLSDGYPALRTLVSHYPTLLTVFADREEADVLLHAPTLPGTQWRVHDLRRPQPGIVKPRRCLPRPARAGAINLFDGHDLRGWSGEHAADWTAANGVLTVGGRTGNMLRSAVPLGDAVIHLEFREPNPPAKNWQHRGNSGVYLMGRYEVQILDSYRNPTFPDGQAGAVFGQSPPLVNASAPPGSWQCFDMVWHAPRFADGRLTAPARLTLRQNGVLVQRYTRIAGPTGYAVVLPYQAHGDAPIELQDHGDAAGRVSFRNIWARPLAR